jgi:hypothetical protein
VNRQYKLVAGLQDNIRFDTGFSDYRRTPAGVEEEVLLRLKKQQASEAK